MSTNSNNKGSQEEINIKRIECVEKQEFDDASRVRFFTKEELCESVVNPLFKTAFKDCNGSFVRVIQPPKGGAVYVELVLDFIPGSDNGNGGVQAYTTIGSSESGSKTDKNSLGARFMAHNVKVSSKESFEITQDAIDMLTPFLHYFASGLKPNIRSWMSSPFTIEKDQEVSRNTFTGEVKHVIHEGITCIDLGKVLEMIFGDRNEKGHKVKYSIQPSMIYTEYSILDSYNQNMMNNLQPPTPQANYLFMVTQLDSSEIKNTCKKVGMFNSSSNNKMNDYPVITA